MAYTQPRTRTQPVAARRFVILIGSDYRVIGYNPENADMDRPRGEIVREVFYLYATDADGYRFSHGAFDSYEAADAAIAAAPPVSLWDADTPEYGSVAYQREDGEAALVDWEARHEAHDAFMRSAGVRDIFNVEGV